MIGKLKPYPAYRDSGLPWVGVVPEHWEVRRNARLFAERNETGFGELPILEVSLKTGVRVRDFGDSHRKQLMSDRDQYKRAAQGDLAYNMMRMWQGAVGVAPVDGLVSPAYVVARPRPSVDGRFYAYLFRTAAYMNEVDKYSRGIVKDRNRLYWEDFKRIPSEFPPPDEQRLIASFLDEHGRRVRQLLRNKRRIVELLDEQKRVIINHAVTHGLDPDIRLKPSGVEWLGDVPEHWEVVSLWLRYAVQLGKMLDAKRITGDYPVHYLRNVDVQWDCINMSDLPVMDIHPQEIDRYTVRSGDLLVCEGGEVGRAAIWNGTDNLGYQKALHRLRPVRRSHDLPRFLLFVLRDVARRGVFLANGSENTIAHLTAEKLRRYRFAFPPFDEQKAIVDYLDGALSSIHPAVAELEREINLIREYRTRLISDVVTGKLDVREAAANLPEERGEVDAIDGKSLSMEGDEEAVDRELDGEDTTGADEDR